jgi:serine/threonine-protein kinase
MSGMKNRHTWPPGTMPGEYGLTNPRVGWDHVGPSDITIPGRDATTVGGYEQDDQLFDVPRGTSIDRYVVTGKVGEGGMGVVYAAYDPELDRKLAIKLLRMGPGSSAGSGSSGDGGRVRLMREAQAMARLRHPNVIAVHDVGTWNDQMFVAMEFVEGGTLNAWLEHRRPKWRECLRMVVKAGRGLAAAHNANLIHRDFKPDNVLISHAGEVFVTDFGLARPMRAQTDERSGALPPHAILDTPLTQTGTLMGTPAYMSPEQFMGRTATAASDQFSFCVTLFVALYGMRPFPGTTMQELMASVAAGRRREPQSRRGVPKWIEKAIVRGLEVRPEDRWPSMDALLEHLEVDPWVTRRRVLGTAAVALVAAAGTGIAVAVTDDAVGARNARSDGHAQIQAGTEESDPSNPCPRPESSLSGVWDDDRRDAVGLRFGLSKLPYAEAMGGRVRTALDDYSKTWLDTHQRACRAARVDRTQSEAVYVLQLSCLDRRRAQLSQLVDVLENANSDLIPRALDVVDRNLADVGGCEDVDALLAEAQRENDPDRRDRIADLEAMLDRAAARTAAGELDEAEKLLDEALNSARSLALPRQEALVLAQLAEVYETRGEFQRAREAYEQTLEACARGKDDRLAAKTWANLVFLVAESLDKPTEAISMESAAKLALVRSGDEPDLRANLSTSLGSAYKNAGRFDEAAAHHEEAIELRKKVFGPDDHRVFDAMSNLANVRFAQGRYEQALQIQQQVLEHRIARLGPDHPQVADSHNNLGGILYTLDRHAEAIEHLEKTIAIREKTMEHDHPKLLAAYANLATAYQMTGRLDESESLLRRVLEAKTKRYGQDHYELALPLNNLANTLERMKRYDEAIELHRRALALRKKRHGSDHRLVAQSMAGLASSLRARGDSDEALALMEKAVAIYGDTTKDEDPQAIQAIEHLAQLHHDRGNVDAAEPLYRRAIELRSASGSNPGDLAVDKFNLAKVLWDRGKNVAAVRLAQEARVSLEGLGVYPSVQTEIEKWSASR